MSNLADIKAERVDRVVTSEREHCITCSVCGAVLDMRRLDQVLAHEERHARE